MQKEISYESNNNNYKYETDKKTSSKNEDYEIIPFFVAYFIVVLKSIQSLCFIHSGSYKKRKEFPMSAAIIFDGCSFLFGKLGGKTTNTKELIIYMV